MRASRRLAAARLSHHREDFGLLRIERKTHMLDRVQRRAAEKAADAIGLVDVFQFEQRGSRGLHLPSSAEATGHYCCERRRFLALHLSTASGQRGWKRHPLGGSAVLGGLPGSATRFGVANARQAGDQMRRIGDAWASKNTSSVGPSSTSCPAYGQSRLRSAIARMHVIVVRHENDRRAHAPAARP